MWRARGEWERDMKDLGNIPAKGKMLTDFEERIQNRSVEIEMLKREEGKY